MRVLALLLMFLAQPGAAHELWIEPLDYTVAGEGRVQADLVNGQHFNGPGAAGEPYGALKLAYIPKWFQRFEVTLGDTASPVAGRMGDTPALDTAALGEGLHVVVYASSGDRLTYDDWAKFEGFARHKDFPEVLTRHLERGLTKDRVTESYTRFSKSLIAVGTGAGADRAFGLETELVALDNPYTDDLKGKIRLRLIYQNAPRADVQVELFAKAPDGSVSVSLHRTDAAGIATLPVLPGHSYMADAVVMREGPDPATAMWESLWANLTFAIPQ